MGRNLIQINERQVQYLAARGMTQKDIADFFEISLSSLKSKYGEVLKRGRHRLELKIRMKQLQVGMKGDVKMLIWLGKQYLGQSEKTEEKNDLKISIVKKIIETEIKEQDKLEENGN